METPGQLINLLKYGVDVGYLYGFVFFGYEYLMGISEYGLWFSLLMGVLFLTRILFKKY